MSAHHERQMRRRSEAIALGLWPVHDQTAKRNEELKRLDRLGFYRDTVEWEAMVLRIEKEREAQRREDEAALFEEMSRGWG